MQENYKKEMYVCHVCDSRIRKGKTYCSVKCRLKHGEQLRTHICDNCKKVFTTEKGPNKHKKKNRKLKFCSSNCFSKYYSGENNPSWRGVKEERNCLTCNKIFVIRKSNAKTRLYCNRICKENRVRLEKERVKLLCSECSTSFEVIKRTNLPKFCSFECKNKHHSIKMRSKGNSNYLHGKANIRYPVEWTKRFKARIRLRDEHICQLCNLTEEQHGKKLCVHHIDFNRCNLEPENLITLCKYCHGKFHGKNTREKCKEELLNLLREKNKYLSLSIT